MSGGLDSASAGHVPGGHGRVKLAGAETMLGIHPTGRPAAQFSGHDGIPALIALTATSARSGQASAGPAVADLISPARYL